MEKNTLGKQSCEYQTRESDTGQLKRVIEIETQGNSVAVGNEVPIGREPEIHIGTNLPMCAIVWIYNISICRSFRYFDSQLFTSYCVRTLQRLNLMLLHSGQVLVIKLFTCKNFFFH